MRKRVPKALLDQIKKASPSPAEVVALDDRYDDTAGGTALEAGAGGFQLAVRGEQCAGDEAACPFGLPSPPCSGRLPARGPEFFNYLKERIHRSEECGRARLTFVSQPAWEAVKN